MLIHNAEVTGSLKINNILFNSGSFSGSFRGDGSQLTGITGATTASYVEYSNVGNKPALVSGSSQITYSGLSSIPAGIVSGSSQVTYSGLTGIPSGIVSGSDQITGFGIFATTGSNQFNGSQAVTGSLTVTGQVVAQTLNVQQVTSSIVYSSGSNIFGNSLGNTQQFTGSVSVTGSLTVNGAVSGASASFTGASTFSGLNLTLNNTGATGSDPLFTIQSLGGGNPRLKFLGQAGVINRGAVGDSLFFGESADTGQYIFRGTGAATFSSSVGINGSPGTNFPLEAYINSSTAYSSTSRGNVFRVYNSNTGANIFAGIELGGAGTANDGLAGLNAIVTGNGSAALTFYTRDSNTFAERIRITSGGNVGIGTTSPLGILDISSGLRTGTLSGLFIGADADTTAGTRTNNTRKLGMIASPHYQNASGSVFGIAMDNQVSNNFIYIGGGYSGYNAATAIAFSTGGTTTTETGTERMRITSGGNVGIGETNPTYKLTIVNAGASTFLGISNQGNSTGDRQLRLGFGGAGADTFATIQGTRLNVADDVNIIMQSGGGNVGIGTISPGERLTIQSSASGTAPQLKLQNPVDSNSSQGAANNLSAGQLLFGATGAFPLTARIESVYNSDASFGRSADLVFSGANGSGTLSERVRITAGGYVRLDTTTGGIQFNGDTAAANALDDYEEGTWTPVIRGSGTAGTYELSTPTYSTYTKIGRQVTVAAQITLQGSITGGGTGYLQITGLPYTKANNTVFTGTAQLGGIDFTGQYVSVKFVTVSPSTVIYLAETVDNGGSIDLPISAISAGDGMSFTLTYFE
jgi:hypothetical protein